VASLQRLLHFTILAAATAAHNSACAQPDAQPYPDKPIRLIEPFPPGGGSNMVARLVSQKLTEQLGYAVVVDSRPGAGGSIGTDIAAKAAPDGYTLLVGTASTMVINPNMAKVGYDPVRDFSAIALVTTIPLIIVVHPSVQAKNIARADCTRARETFAAQFRLVRQWHCKSSRGRAVQSADQDADRTCPVQGWRPALIDLLGGQVQMTFNNILSALPHVRADKIRALAVSGAQRSPAVPEVPTAIEAGLPGYEVLQWNGFFAPAHTRRDIVMKLNSVIVKAVSDPAMREKLAADGAEIGGGSPERFASFVATEYAKWGKVIRAANIRGEY
jgi:tripartite-type tricarboxylate transporter receptor subunit TctC